MLTESEKIIKEKIILTLSPGTMPCPLPIPAPSLLAFGPKEDMKSVSLSVKLIMCCEDVK